MLRKGGVIFVLKLAGTALVLIANVLMNQVVGFESFGQYVYLMGFVNILVVVTCFGGDTYLKRSIAKINESVGSKSWSVIVTRDIRSMLRQLLLIWAFSAVFVWFFLVWSRNTVELSNTITFLLVCAAVLLLSSVRLASGAFIGMSKAFFEALITSFFKPIFIVANIGVVYLFVKYLDYQPNTNTLLMVQVVMLCILLVISYLVYYAITKKEGQSCDPSLHIQKASSKNKLSTGVFATLIICLPLAFVSSTVILERNIDILMLGALDSSDSSALYFICTRISALFLMPLFILNSLVLPSIAKNYKSGNLKALEERARTVALYSSFAAFMILIVTCFLGKSILLQFGDEYISAYPPLIILAVGNFARTLIGPIQMVCLMCNMERQVAKINIGSLAVNIGLNVLLIPAIGILGAVVATVVTRLGRSVVLAISLKRKLNVNVGVLTFGLCEAKSN